MAEDWRLITDAPRTGLENMAIDEAMVRAFEQGVVERPTLRLYSWSEPTVSIGAHQDGAPYEGMGLPVVRRLTGGRAVLHSAELTYSVVAPVAHPALSSLDASYRVISLAIANALMKCGVPAELARVRSKMTKSGLSTVDARACFSSTSRYEVCIDGKKVAGSAQRRFKRAFLQHGSVLFDVNVAEYARVFGNDALNKLTWVRRFGELDVKEFSDSFVLEIKSALQARFIEEGLAPEEKAIKEATVSSIFDSPRLCSGCR